MSELVCRALEGAAKSAAAAEFRHGFCFDAGDDLAFALGFPYLRYLDADSFDDLDPRANAENKLLEPGTELSLVFAPRTAALLARGWLLPEPATPYPDELELTDEASDVLDSADAVSEDVVEPALRAALSRDEVAPTLAEALLLWEALVGTEATVFAAVAAIGDLGRDPSQLVVAPVARAIATTLLMARRLPKESASRSSLRIERAMTKLSTDERDRAGLVWSGPAASVPLDAPTLSASPKRILATIAANIAPGRWLPDSRLAFLGGTDILDLVVASFPHAWAGLSPEVIDEVVAERFAPIRHPRVVELVVALANRSPVPKKYDAWFLEHRDYVASELYALTQSDSRWATSAARVAQRIGA